MQSHIKKSLQAGTAFAFASLGTFIAYAAISSVWTSTTGMEATSSTQLSSSVWNQLVGNVQQLKDSSTSAGTVAQMKVVQTRAQNTYTAPISGNGTAISPLDVTITPKKAGNMVVLEWNVHGEIVHNGVFLVTRNGTLMTNSVDASNNRWSGVATADYDTDNNSTPNEKVVRFVDFNSLDTASTYSLLVRSSDASAYTFYLNRSIWTIGDAYEVGSSTATATEVYQ